MIRDEQLPELPKLRRAERRLPLRPDDKFSDLVVATQNGEIPVHRWFRLKESFSPNLLKAVLQDIFSKMPDTLSILDPFAGVGTTLLSAQQLTDEGPKVQAVGIERNPFFAFAARTKISRSEINGSRLLQDGAQALELAENLRPVLPSLSSIRTGRCMSIPTSRKILTIRDAIKQVAKGAQADALLLGLAAAIEPLSKTRKDGRPLRIVDRKSPRIVATIVKNMPAVRPP